MFNNSEEDYSFGESEDNYINVGLDYCIALDSGGPTYKKLAEENHHLEKVIEEIYESDSWKNIEPIRRIVRLFYR